MDPMRGQRIAFAVLGAVALLAPLLAPNAYVMGVIARICLYALLALGLNIVVGFAGLLDIGYVAFFGIGSYVYAFLASPHFGLHLPFLVALPIVVAITALSGVIIGAPTLRVRGDYLAMVTLGFGEIVYLLLVNLDRPVNITGGPSGIIGVDPPRLAGLMPGSNTEYYFLFLVFLGLAVLISMRLRDSRIGWAWQAIREDEVAAQAMGINVFVAKLQAFAIGASFAGVGGCLLASWQHSVFPANFMFTESINILAMVILGGMGNLFGVILGAALIVALPELFREFEQYRLLAFGLMLMVLMVFRPQGLLTFQGRRQAVPVETPEPVPGAVPARSAPTRDGVGSRAAAQGRSPPLRDSQT
jgi:branched-chain amino acid transport system permease protein